MEELFASGLLARDELAHPDGEAIRFSLSAGAESSWGRPDHLTPLIDLPPADVVTEDERDAYDEFAGRYRRSWAVLDPIIAGVDLKDGELGVDARVLPVVENSDYDDIRDIAGEARVSATPDLPGIRFTFAVGEDVRLRRRLDRLASKLAAGPDLGLGWLGGWVEVGALDRRALAAVAQALDERIQLPEDGAERGLARFAALTDAPVYVAAEIRNEAALAATLMAARAAAMAAAPAMVEWGEHSKHSGHAVVEVRGPEDTSLYYAMADDVFVVALTLPTLQVVLDRIGQDRRPTAAEDGGQLIVNMAAAPRLGLSTTLAWLLHAQALESQRAALVDAEVLLRGRPDLAPGQRWEEVALRTFGGVPIDAAGSTRFTLGPVGARSRSLGSHVAPHYPALPIPGSRRTPSCGTFAASVRRFRSTPNLRHRTSAACTSSPASGPSDLVLLGVA